MIKKYNKFILIFLLCFTYSTIFYDTPVSAQETATLSTTTISVENDTVICGFPLKIFFFFSLNKYIYLMDVYPRIHQIILNQPIALDIWIVIVLKG